MNGETESPVYRSILTPPLTLGIPNNLFLFLLVTGMSIVISLGQIWFIVPLVLMLVIGKIICAKDVFNIDIILRLIKLPEVMD
jgi:type IV secretory pathway VirB3-like protein